MWRHNKTFCNTYPQLYKTCVAFFVPGDIPYRSKLNCKMKKVFILIFLLSAAGVSKSQFYKSFMPSGAFTDSLGAVVGDFRHNFHNLQGERLLSGDDREIYRSAAGLPGSIDCIIYRYHSVMDSAAGWQAVMYRGDDYKEAIKMYKNTFRLVKKARLYNADRIGMGFTGEMDEPNENLRFAVSTLYAKSSDRVYDKFVAEIEIVTVYSGFEVHLNLHNKRDDKEGPVGYLP